MTLLDRIVAQKYKEVKERKDLCPVNMLEKSRFFNLETRSLKHYLLRNDLNGIIAEFKRKSPSRGIMNEFASAEKVGSDYIMAGASAVSVLTDNEFFGGSSEDLITIRDSIDSPILRKDFIVDEYQIVEARAIGADAILLIAALHQPERIEKLHRFALSLGLEVLLEVHDKNEISVLPGDTQIVGINCRNLASLEVDNRRHSALIKLIPAGVIKIAESGIRSPSDLINLREAGFDGFLIGELFMNTEDPGKSCQKFIDELREVTTPEKRMINKKVDEKN